MAVFLIGAIIVIIIGIFFLKLFNKIAGRGPKQVKNVINQSIVGKDLEKRVPCPHCSEKILPSAKKCPFCKSDLN
jgi:hypothetical protein